MDLPIDDIASDLFDIFKGFGKIVTMYDESGKQVYDPSMGRRFYAMPDKMMLSIDPAGLDTEVKLYLSKGSDLEELNKLIQTLRITATRYNILFNVRKYDRDIKPKDFAYRTTQEMSESMWGTTKSSYQKIGTAKLIVRHTDIIPEDRFGSRSRMIKDIFIETRIGERFRCPVPTLHGGRAICRHISEAGSLHDDIGRYLIHLSEEFINLGRFSSYLYDHRKSMKPVFENIRFNVRYRMNEVRSEFASWTRPKSYRMRSKKFEGFTPITNDPAMDSAWMKALNITENHDIVPSLMWVYRLNNLFEVSSYRQTKLGGTMSTLPEMKKIEEWFGQFDTDARFLKEALETVATQSSRPAEDGYAYVDLDLGGAMRNLKVHYRIDNNPEDEGQSFDITQAFDTDTGEDITGQLSEFDKDEVCERIWNAMHENTTNEGTSDARKDITAKIAAFNKAGGVTGGSSDRKAISKKLSDMAFKMNRGRKQPKVAEDVLGLDLEAEVLDLLRDGMTREEMASYLHSMGVSDEEIQQVIGLAPGQTDKPNMDTDEAINEIKLPRDYDSWRTDPEHGQKNSDAVRAEKAYEHVINNFDVEDFLYGPYGKDFAYGDHDSTTDPEDLNYKRDYIAKSLQSYLENEARNLGVELEIPSAEVDSLLNSKVIPVLTSVGYTIDEASGPSHPEGWTELLGKMKDYVRSNPGLNAISKAAWTVPDAELAKYGFTGPEAHADFANVLGSILFNKTNNPDGTQTRTLKDDVIDGVPERYRAGFNAFISRLQDYMAQHPGPRAALKAALMASPNEFQKYGIASHEDLAAYLEMHTGEFESVGEDLELEDILTPKEKFLVGTAGDQMDLDLEDDCGCEIDNTGLDLIGDVLSDCPVDPTGQISNPNRDGQMSPISGQDQPEIVELIPPTIYSDSESIDPSTTDSLYQDQLAVLKVLAGLK